MSRASFYFDGFNLYHAIVALGDPRLKWIDLRSLALSYVKDGFELADVAFFTAINTWDAGKRKRHLNYVKALEATGVQVELSNFLRSHKYCKAFDRRCRFNEEKQTDVKLALRILADCIDDKVALNRFLVERGAPA